MVIADSVALISLSSWKPPVTAVRPSPSASNLVPLMLRLDEPVSLKVTLRVFSFSLSPER